MSNTIVYKMVTERILEELKKGIIPWRKPWMLNGGTGAFNYASGRVYSLLNQMILKHQDAYITEKKLRELKAKLKPGAKPEYVFEFFAKDIFTKDKNGNIVLDEDGNPKKFTKFNLLYYKVFWVGDVEGLKPKKQAESKLAEVPEASKIVENYVKKSGIKFYNGRSKDAYYAPALDMVVVPGIKQYKNIAEYYSTTFHELVHSTGHKDRLNRFTDEKSAAFGSQEYSKEELVAEIGAATLVNAVGLENKQSFKNSAAYIQAWIKRLQNDETFIVSASSKAEKAVKYILAD